MKLTLLRTVICLLLFIGMAPFANAQSISPGDLLFTGINIFDDDNNGSVQNDVFSFVLLRDCPANTKIYFTDLGWTGSGFQSLSCGVNTGSQTDGVIMWSSGGSVIKAGQQVIISCKFSPSASIGTITAVNPTQATAAAPVGSREYISLGLAGDELFAFTGNLSSPTIIAGINVNRKTWEPSLNACDFTSSGSVQPGTTATLAFPSVNAVNARYNCNSLAGTPGRLRTLLQDTTNWNKDYTLAAPSPVPFDLKKTAPCNLTIVNPSAAGIVYVNNQSATPGDGSSWSAPLPELRDALLAAADPLNGITQIWVAKGTYKPTAGTDRSISLVIPSNVAVYGGFAGSETNPSQRNIPNNPVILSGDIDNNDILTGGITLNATDIRGNNSYHVIQVNNTDVSTLLDGVIITGGNAQGTGIDIYGGGMYTLNGNITISNTRFNGNKASANGGAMYNNSVSNSTVQLINCAFSGNAASSGSGGGAITANYSTLKLTNVTIAGNNAPTGSGLFLIKTAMNTYNTIISGNSGSPAIGFAAGSFTTYQYSIIDNTYYTNNTPSQSTPAVQFVNLNGGDLRLQVSNFAINKGDPQTNNNGYPVQAGTVDLAGAPRINNTTIDLGAYEYQAVAQTITFPVLAAVTYGDSNIDPLATTSGDGTITYTSDKTTVADIISGKIKTTGAGTAQITANASATNGYLATSPGITRTLTVNKKALTVTANNATRVYGTANPTFLFTYTGFVYSEDVSVVHGTVTGSTTATQSSPVGTYPITTDVSGANADNYSFTVANGTLTITQAPQTITFNAPSSVVYGSAPIQLPLNTNAGLAINYTVVSGPATVSGNTLTITGAGDVTVTAAQPGNVNYLAATSVTQTFTVSKASLAVNALNKTRAYNQANPILDYNITGFVNGENNSVVSGSAAISTTADINSSPGSYPITIGNGSLSAVNYQFTFTNATLTITKADQTITFPAISNQTYGVAPITLNATSDAGLSVSYNVSGPATISGNVLTITGSGMVTVTATQSGDINYNAALPVPRNFSVGKAMLMIKPDDKTRPYGQNNPTLTYSYSGFVNTDDQSVVNGIPALSTTAGLYSLPGTYPITVTNAASLSAANYMIVPASGSLSVTVATQSINFPAISSKTYGDGTFTLNATSNSGLPISYSVIGGPATISGNTVTITGTGTVTINANQAGDGNYNPAQQETQTFTINKAVLTVTANNKTRAYQQANPVLDYAITGYVNGENSSVVSGTADISTSANTNSAPGTYPISVTAGNLNAANYSFNFTDGTLTVVKAAQTISFAGITNKTYGDAAFTLSATSDAGLPVSFAVTSGPATISGNTLTITGVGTVTVTATQNGDANYNAASPVSKTFTVAPAALNVKADDKQRIYGLNNPAFTYTITGFVYTDDNSVVSGAPALSTTANAGSAAGTYPINITAGNLSAANYTFTLTGGTLTIGPADQTISLPAISDKTYGDGSFTLNATSTSGLPVSYSVASGPATISGNTVTITGAGTVTINANQAGDGNYNPAQQVSATFTVNKAVLTVTANSKTRAYNQANPVLDYVITGYVNSENSSVVSGTAAISTSANATSAPGTYPISVTAGSLSAANYSFSFTAGILTVVKAAQAISFAGITDKTYGDAAFTLNATSDAGLPVSFTVTSGPATISGNTLTITGAGTVTVTATQNGDANYNAASPVSRTFTVAPAALNVKADDKQRNYGLNNPALTYTITGFVYTDDNSVVSGAPALSTTANTGSAAGTYPISISAGNLSAANYTFTLTNGTLTVGPTDQTISFPAISDKTYGDGSFTLSASSSSGLPVSYAVASGPATISGNTVTITGAGTVTIVAYQGGNSNYNAAPQAARTFNVGKAALTVTAKNDTRTYNGNAYSGGNGVDYTGWINSDNAAMLQGQLSYSGTSQGAVNAGSYVISPAGLSSSNYSISYVSGTLTINRATQQISFTAPGYKNQGDPDFTFTATASSGLPISFTSDNNAVISINGNTARVGDAGTAIITATQAGNNNYEPAQAVIQVINVTAYKPPVITASGNTTFCEGGNVTLQASTAPAYEWYRNNVLISGANNSSLLVSQSGNYTVKAIYAHTALTSAATTVTVNPMPDGSVQANGNTTISKGEKIVLVASGGDTYTWDPTAGLNNPAIAAPVARPAQTTTYRVTITSAAGCSVTKEITITVKEDYKLEATNILTPNGDGKNDLWIVRNIDMYPQNEVKVFDRTGRMVYHQRGYTNNWNCTVNGQPLAEGTYYYIIDLGNNKPQFKGFITIIHEN
ncbi:MBG domain-containing protein [Chitinophaga sp. HK235]|uniref:MBG domain-containing protein n=1 Tax=Chitinophaga sp. HK235 TaxID=2952571 RepID=UPI001BA6A9AE|nr:MBG domain-containing protein [Chitinophaga sp. HK235]